MAGHKKSKQQEPEAEAPRPAANDSVGETLRAIREARKLSVDVVAKALHIRAGQIKAIEENNIESLPGMTYAVGFVRSYANYLGLNGADIVHKFKAEHGHDPAQSKLSFPQPVAESRVPDAMMVGVGVFLAVVILVLWTVYSNMHGGSAAKVADKIPPAPVVTSVADGLPSTTSATAATTTAPAATTTTSAPLAGATTTPAVTDPTTTTATSGQPAVAATVPATIATAVDATAAATTAQAPAIAAPAVTTATAETTAATTAVAAATPAVTPTTTPAAPAAKAPAKKASASDDADTDEDAANDNDDDTAARKADKKKDDDGVIKIKKGKSRITLKATAPSWVQVTSSNGDVLYRKVLRPGETYSVPDQPGLKLDTANAGALDISVDGKDVRPIGKNGDILRGVSLEPQSLKGARIRD